MEDYTPKHTDYNNISVIEAKWLSDPKDFLEQINENTQAVLFITIATEPVSSDITTAIDQTIDKGIPVFFLSDDDWKYPGLQEGKNTRAIMMENIDTRHVYEVVDAIKDAIQGGYTWVALWNIIKDGFTYKVWEVIPPKGWKTPEWTTFIEKLSDWIKYRKSKKNP